MPKSIKRTRASQSAVEKRVKAVQTLQFRRSDVSVHPTLFGLRLSMKEFSIDGAPGEPALPHRIFRVALPKGHAVKTISQKIGQTVLLNHTPEPLACISAPSIGDKPDLPHARFPRTQAWPDKEKYRAAFASGKKVCRLAGQEMMGLIPFALIDVWPVRFTKEGLLELVEEVTLTVVSAPSAKIAREEKALLRALPARVLMRRHLIAEDQVLNPILVQKELRKNTTAIQKADAAKKAVKTKSLRKGGLAVPMECDYLIVTDNSTWDAATISPTGEIGEMAGVFARLAQHKKSRGLRPHVARVKDIVDGRYGDFKTGARDLQEVIRNFLKWFCGSRGVEFLLLGGDVGMIPARQVAASAWGQIDFGTLSERRNVSEWKGAYLGMRIDPNEFARAGHTLVNYNTGRIIPFDSAGTSNATSAGWYHTSDDTFATRTAANTEWVRVNGPQAQANAKMVWHTPNNLIPSDLYYASLYGEGYNVPGRHDWDQLNNGLYGQHYGANNFDSVNYRADVSVGRAPVETVAEAETFVNKILEYENWGSAPRPEADYDRFRRMLFAAATWGKYTRIERDPANVHPPANNTYRPSGEHALLHCDTLPPDAGDQLLCYFDDRYYLRLGYNAKAKHNVPGWYYAKSADDLSASVTVWDFFFFEWEFPRPTPWIVVWDGNDSVLHPMYYALDFSTLDGSISEQESLRETVQSLYPEISD